MHDIDTDDAKRWLTAAAVSVVECTALFEQIEEVRFAIARGFAMTVWIVLTPEGEPWCGQAFGDVDASVQGTGNRDRHLGRFPQDMPTGCRVS
jgi:hypothetical protein